MLNTIKQWLEPPIFPDDEEKNGLARLVNTLGLYFAFLLLLDAFIYVPFFVTQKTFALIVVAALMILYAISRLALFRGQIKLSNLILVIGTWAVFQGLSIFSGGVNVPASFVIIATIIIIRLLIQTRISYIILLLSILIELCLAFLQTNKYELPTFLYFSPLSSWFWFTLTLGFVFSTVNLISHNLQDALNQAQKQHKKRDEVEQALRQSEERFRMFMQYFPGLAFMKDTDGKILFANQGFYTYLGLNPEEMIGKTNQTIFRDEFGIKISCDDQFVLESGTSQVIDENFAGKTWTTHKFCINQRDAKPLLGGIAIDTTAQKMADEALREREARFRTLLQNVSMVSVQGYSPDGTTNYWNQASERLYGYTAQEAIGRNLLDLIIPPEMRSDVQKAIQQMTKTGQPIPGSELSLIHRDGSLVEVFSSHAIIQTPGHEPELFCIDIDLTERKRTEQALKQTQEEFLAVVQTANEAIITINEQQTITFWNTEAESIFGFSVDEMIGKPFTQIVPFHLREINKQAVKRVLAGGTMRLAGKIIEVTGLNKEGKEFPIEMSLAEWKTQTGHFITAIIRDISKRKRAEKRMEQSEKKYRELFQLNNDGITIVGLAADRTNKMFIELNEASHNMLGYSKEEMLRLSPEILEPDITIEQLQSRQNELKFKGITKFETILTQKNGQRVYAEFISQSIHYEGQPAIMNIIHNITERRQHEDELQTIATLSSALRTASNRAEMLPKIVEQLVNQLNFDSVIIEIIDPSNDDSVIEAAIGSWKHLKGSRKKKGVGINTIIRNTLQPNFIYDTKKEAKKWSRNGIYDRAGVPLIAQEKLIGYIRMKRNTDMSESEIRLLSAIADIAANAIHRTTLHEQAVKAATELSLAYDTTLEGWAHALELRDHETEGHARRVVQMTLDLALIMGVSEEMIEDIRRGAILHDIGKMGIPDSVLLKAGTLNDGEWKIMRRHPEYAHELLTPITYLNLTLDIPFCHHEKWDGSGYPRGLKGDEIPFAARIFAIVDVWDALTSNRPYRVAWQKEKALDYIIEQSGKHFDPIVVDGFLKLLNRQVTK